MYDCVKYYDNIIKQNKAKYSVYDKAFECMDKDDFTIKNYNFDYQETKQELKETKSRFIVRVVTKVLIVYCFFENLLYTEDLKQ